MMIRVEYYGYRL